MTISEPGTPTLGKSALLDGDLDDAIREYLRTYVMWRGIQQATATFGVSRHTLWRFLRRGRTGHALPRAVMGIVGDSVEVLEAATWAVPAVERLVASRPAPKPIRSPYPLSQALEDTLLLLCTAPLATVDELSRFGRIPASTLRDRLKKLAKMGMADSVSHSLGILGPHPHLRHFPTEKGIEPGQGLNGERRPSCGSTRCPGSGSGSWPTGWTPWPRSTAPPPWSPTPTPRCKRRR